MKNMDYTAAMQSRATIGVAAPLATSFEQLIGGLHNGLERLGRMRRQLEVIADRIGAGSHPNGDEKIAPEAHTLHGTLQIGVNSLHSELDRCEQMLANLYPVLFDTSNAAQAAPGR